MSVEQGRAIADAVLFGGASGVSCPLPSGSCAPRTVGLLAPAVWSEAHGAEAWWMRLECLMAADPEAAIELDGQLRFLQLPLRRIRPSTDVPPRPEDAATQEKPKEPPQSPTHPAVREIDFRVDLPAASHQEQRFEFEHAGGWRIPAASELPRTGPRIEKWWPMRGVVRVRAETLQVETHPAEHPIIRLRIVVENRTPWSEPAASRDAVLHASWISAHIVLACSTGSFVSLIDPPSWAGRAAASCENVRTFPVLAGRPERDDILLSAPIILGDHPRTAPPTAPDLVDSAEVEEMLALQRLLLAGDEVPVSSPPRLAPGVRVRLRPQVRGGAPPDGRFAGRTATVERAMQGVDGRRCFVVCIDRDATLVLPRWLGRYQYYYADELEPLEL